MDKYYGGRDVPENQELRALDGIHARIIRINNRVRSVDEVLENTACRIFGPMPKNLTDGRLGAEPSPDSSIDKLHAALLVLETIADRLETNSERLNGV